MSAVKARRSKWGNIPTRSVHTGRMFQSRLEASREPVLLALQNAGEIADLEYQTRFQLEVYSTPDVAALLDKIEALYDADTTMGRLAHEVRLSRQKICEYRADFTYRTKAGQFVAEDTKGYPTPEYRIKKRLMVAAYDIDIEEPNVTGVQQRARGCGIKGKGTGSRLRGGR